MQQNEWTGTLTNQALCVVFVPAKLATTGKMMRLSSGNVHYTVSGVSS